MADSKQLSLGVLRDGKIEKPFVLHWAVKGPTAPAHATDVASDTAMSSTPVAADTAILSTPVAADTAITSTPVAADTAMSSTPVYEDTALTLVQAIGNLFPQGERIQSTVNKLGTDELADTIWS